VEASPLREKLRVKGAGFVSAFRFVFGTYGKRFSWIGGTEEELAARAAGYSGDLRRARFGELRENAAAIDGQQRAIVAGAGEQATIGIKRERVNDILAGIPEFFGSAFGREPIDAAGKLLRERNEGRLALRLATENDRPTADGGGTLRRGDNGCGRGNRRGTLLFADRRGVDGA